MGKFEKVSPEVRTMLEGAEGLYEALKRAKPTRALAEAIAAGTAFEKLQDAEILVCCNFWREIGKLAKAGAEAQANGTTGEAITPEVLPPKGKPENKSKDGKKDNAAT